MAGMSCERLGLCSPTPVMFDVSPEMHSTSARKYKSSVPTNPLLQLSQIHFHRFSQSQGIVSHAPTPARVVCAKNFVHVKMTKAVNNKDGSSSEIRRFHFHNGVTQNSDEVVQKWRRVGKRGGVALWLSACVSCNAAAALSSYQQRQNRFAVGAAAVHKYSYSLNKRKFYLTHFLV